MEMSDWSSDVCSSDLRRQETHLRSEFQLLRRVSRLISACFGRFRPVLAVLVTGRYNLIWPIRPDSGRISPVRRESKPIQRESKKKKNSDVAPTRGQPRRTPRRATSDSGAAPSQPRPCILANKLEISLSLSLSLSQMKTFTFSNELIFSL